MSAAGLPRLKVERARVVVNFQVVESKPKTDKSACEIALDPETVTALRRHNAGQKVEKIFLGADYADNDLVFTKEDGTPFHPELISKWFTRLTKAVETAGHPAPRSEALLRHGLA
jgi:hypothetical protein